MKHCLVVDDSAVIRKVARRILDAHKELASLIEMRDAAGARRLMDEHVKMIAARRVAEHRDRRGSDRDCC